MGHRPSSQELPEYTMTYRCIFSEPGMREQRDLIQRLWRSRFGKSAPFGYFTKTWRERHCATLNPYGSEDCPYAKAECMTAFGLAAMDASNWLDPKGRFYHSVRASAAMRADNKPLSRDRMRTDGPQGPGDSRGSIPRHQPRPDPGLGGGAESRTRDESDQLAPTSGSRDMRRSGRGLVPMDEVLRSLDLGPHQKPTTDGKESRKR